MAIIKKRMDELTVGDIVLLNRSRCVITHAVLKGDGHVALAYAIAGTMAISETNTLGGRGSQAVDVDAPDNALSADDLDLLITSASECVERDIGPERLRALVDRLRPPEPPTLAEALAALDAVRTSSVSGVSVANARDRVDDILNRARRAGLLPKEGD